jgi:hypothetical protein
MPREITDEEYSYLQGRRQVADFVESIYNDPQLNNEAKRLIKRKYPNLSIPDYDIEARVTRRLDAEKKARDDAEAATRKKTEDEDWKTKRAAVQKDYGLTDEAMKEMEADMIARNIGDYEAAALLYASKHPKSSEPTYDSGFWKHEQTEGFKEIAKDPEGWARKEIMGALARDESAKHGGR